MPMTPRLVWFTDTGATPATCHEDSSGTYCFISAHKDSQFFVKLDPAKCSDYGGCTEWASRPEQELIANKLLPIMAVVELESEILVVPLYYYSGNIVAYAPVNAKKVTVVGYRIENGAAIPCVFDSNLNPVEDVVYVYAEYELNGKRVTLYLPATIPLAVAILIGLGIIGATTVGAIWGWGYVKHGEAAVKHAEAELKNAEAMKEWAIAYREAIRKARDEETIKAVVSTMGVTTAAVHATTVATQKPQSNVQDWGKAIMDTIMKYIVPFVIPIIGVMVLIFKWQVIIEAFRSLFRSLRERR